MPNIKSAAKRARTSERARQRNMAVKSRIKHVRMDILEMPDGTTPEKALELYRNYCSLLDKAAKKGVIKKNTAIRRKTRAAARVKKLSDKPAAPAGA